MRTLVIVRRSVLVLLAAAVGAAEVEAQGADRRWPLQPQTGIGRIVAPFLEGWYPNEDGSYSYSFGYLNLNDHSIEIPRGEANAVTPAEFDGMQPTVFEPGRHRGVFAVTVPADQADVDVWWTITNPNGEVAKVPGRHNWGAYMLDYNPRPHGTMHPLVWFEDGEQGRGPRGVVAEETLTATAGEPITLEVNVRDPSQRDTTDYRFWEPVPVRVVWFEHQSPLEGDVVFARHESTPVAEEEENADVDEDEPTIDPEAIVELPAGEGTARVIATFTQPGEYVVRVQADNFAAVDSDTDDQCCWTNGYVRVTVR
ncbi:MAG TPA: hypothetical protein VFQ22_01605 [Longimicrobiales bacterium]|nr:hypothetical protein [Longimicrobiales bacterium]